MRRTLWLCALALLPCAAQTPQIVAPQIFEPGVISGPGGEDCPAFSPEGDTLFFDRSRGADSLILVSHRVKGGWSAPEIAPFSGQWLDHDPAMAPDGSFLVFVSNRPSAPGGKALDALAGGKLQPAMGGHLWRVARKGAGWGEPEELPAAINASDRVYAPCVAGDGSLYFIRPEGKDFHIFRSQLKEGAYQPAQRQLLGAPEDRALDPCVAPDESFIIFDAKAAEGSGDHLHVAFREGGGWGRPQDLGEAVNGRDTPWGAHLGPGGRLYFTSGRTTPVRYPRSRAESEAQLAQTRAWDNGADNIWSIELKPLLDGLKK